jgi:dihydrofolate reductase
MSGGVPAPPLVLVAAVARNRAIGRDNKLLWRLKSDMAHFRACTMGKPILMGRKTWDSIGRPLPGREIVVVTRDPTFQAEGVLVASDLGAARALAGKRADAMGAGEIVVAGGGEIYAALIDRARRLRITEVDLAPEADAFFPVIDTGVWRETSREHHAAGAGDEAAFDFVDYERV